MKKLRLLLLTLISAFVLISCSSAPITGRQQLKFVDDEKLAKKTESEKIPSIIALRKTQLSGIDRILFETYRCV